MNVTGRFENNSKELTNVRSNVALYLEAKGSTVNNFAIKGTGNCALNGSIVGYKYHKHTPGTSSSSTTIKYSDGCVQVLYESVSGKPGVACLPRMSEVRRALGIGSSDTFIAPLTLISLISIGNITLSARGGISGTPSDYPKLRNGSTKDLDSITIAPGDAVWLLLIYDGGEYYAPIISHVS